jgi:hypothetical protein
MQTFWQLLRESVLVQSLVTLLVISAVVYLYICGREVPPDLIKISLLILGYWFGTKSVVPVTTNTIQRIAREEVQYGRESKA